VEAAPLFDFDTHRTPSADVRAHRDRWREIEAIEDGTPTEKRKHHFVPQLWLRRWLDPQTGLLTVVDAERARHFPASTGNVMHVNDLYRVGVELTTGTDMGPEEAFSRIEDAAARAIAAVLGGQALTDDARYDLALLIALQHVRTPDVVATAVPEDPVGITDFVHQVAAEFLAAPDAPAPPEFEHALGRSRHQLAERLLDGLPTFNAMERGFGFWRLLDIAHHFAGRIYTRDWTFIASTWTLMLGDNPVPAEPLGETTRKARGEITVWDTPVPLDPDTLLLIGNRPRGTGLSSPVDADGYSVMSNDLQVYRAERFVIAPPDPKAAAR
jgi:hypothetical protein